MVSNFFTLLHIAETLHDRLKTATVEAAFSQERGILTIGFSNRSEHLVVSCLPEASTCYLHRRISRARRNSADVLPDIVGETVVSVSMHPCDRVLSIHFVSAHRLVIQFFGARSNALVLNAGDSIIDAFKNGRRLAGSAYTAPPGSTFPSLDDVRASFAFHLDLEVVRALRTAIPSLGPLLAQEVIDRTGIPSSTPVRILDSAALHRTLAVYQTLLDELRHPQPRIYFSDADKPALLSLIALRHRAGSREELYADIHEAIQRVIGQKRSRETLLTRRQRVHSMLHGLETRTRRSIGAMAQELNEHDRVGLYQQYGSLLLSHVSQLHKGMLEFTISSVGESLRIPLDPSLGPQQNAQRYFDKAKHARRSRERALARSELLERRLATVTTLLHRLESATSREDLDHFMKTERERLAALGVEPSQEKSVDRPFRMFVVDGGFEVWAGKDNANNDLLTLRHARPQDLWFHARGVPGSHVVLRVSTSKGPPGKKAREQAAAIAAYYSKMRKAGMVPVTMTERKYVRKPKGAPPGTVAVAREVTVFATPGLPPSAEPDTENE